jgi:hypothetical protein
MIMCCRKRLQRGQFFCWTWHLKSDALIYSWNAYNCDVNSDKIKQAIDAMVVFGLRAYGYEYVNSKYF